MKNFNLGDDIRLYDYPENSKNAYVTIKYIYPNGEIWISNKHKKLPGTIDKIVTAKTLKTILTKK